MYFFRKDEACNHVAALLETLVDVTNKKKDGTLASTSTKCKWNNPRKRKLSPKKAQDLNFSRKNSVKRQLNTETPANLGIPAKDLGIKKTFDENIFKQTLMANKSNAAWLTLLETQQVQEQRVPELTSVSFMFNDSVDLKTTTVQEKFQEIFHNQNVSEHDSAEIEKLTRGHKTKTNSGLRQGHRG